MLHYCQSKECFICLQDKQTLSRYLFKEELYDLYVKVVYIKRRKIHMCEQCNQMFTSKFILYKHINEKHGKIKYICNLCNKSYNYDMTLVNHIKTKHATLTFVCITCNEEFTCDNLSKCYKGISNPTISKDEVSDIMVYICHLCKPDKSYKQEHNTKVKLNKEKYTCDKCDESFINKYRLKMHIYNDHNEYNMDLDSIEFSNLLQVHIEDTILHNLISEILSY